MAMTAANIAKTRLSNRFLTVTTLTPDASYPTGGEAVTANDLSLSGIDEVIGIYASAGYVATWDRANSKVMVYYADYDAVADGPLIQVPNTTDLSAATVITITAIGT